MGFGRRAKGLVSSWVSTPKVEKENDPVFAKKAQHLDGLQKTLNGLQENMKLYLSSWQSMCQASAAIAEGLVNLATEGDAGKASPLYEIARAYQLAHRSIDEVVREPANRTAEDMVLRQTAALLNRFPPMYRKIARRRELLVDFTLAASKLRTAEAASQRDKYRDGSGAAAELRRKLATSLETAASVANGVTQEVMADVDRLEDERGTMLVPQVSALVGCQAYFFRRSAAILERLASSLPYSALALSSLVQARGAAESATPVTAPSSSSGGGVSYAPASTLPLDPSLHPRSSTSSFSSFNSFADDVPESSPATSSSPFADGGGIRSSAPAALGGGESDSSNSFSRGFPQNRRSLPTNTSVPMQSVPLTSTPPIGGGDFSESSISRRPLPPPPPPPPLAMAPTATTGMTQPLGASNSPIDVLTDGATGSSLLRSPPLMEEEIVLPDWAVDGDDDDDVVVEEVVW